MNTVIVGTAAALATVGGEVEFAVIGANAQALDLKQSGINGGIDIEGVCRIVADHTGSAFHIVNSDGAGGNGGSLVIAAQRNEDLIIVILKTLIHPAGQVPDGAAKIDGRLIDVKQLGQFDGTTGLVQIQLAGEEIGAGFEHKGHIPVVRMHHRHTAVADLGTVVGHIVAAHLGQLGATHGKAHQRTGTGLTGGDEHITRTVHINDIHIVGMTQVGKILIAGGIGHVHRLAGVLVDPGNTGIGIAGGIGFDGIQIIAVDAKTLHAVAVTLVIDQSHGGGTGINRACGRS